MKFQFSYLLSHLILFVMLFLVSIVFLMHTAFQDGKFESMKSQALYSGESNESYTNARID